MTDNPPAPTAEAAPSPLMSKVLAVIGDLVASHTSFRGDDTIHVARENILRVAELLRDSADLAFDMLMDVTAVDYLGQPDGFTTPTTVWDRDLQTHKRIPISRHHLVLPERGPEPRFAVVYHMLSTKLIHRLRVKCRVPEDDPTIASVTSIWTGANWLERETFDLYGIRFTGHPDLRRIYLHESFVGHPLRKDYQKRANQAVEPHAGPAAKEPRRPN
jgi:NADH-quinone oxidoreductase subunit C